MGGGGGDGGYEARQQQTEQEKGKARQALNALFGFAPTQQEQAAFAAGAPTREKFTTHYGDISIGENGGTGMGGDVFDEAGYNQALAAHRQQASLADRSVADANAQARDSLYQQVRQNAYDAGKRQLDEGLQEAKRKNKFELFARGLAGGSEDIDQNAKIGRTYSQGIMDLGAKADAAKAGFRNADEETRLQLLQSIDNGMDQGSALSSATNRMAIAADQASADAQGTALGNVFDSAGLLYSQSQRAKGANDAQEWWRNYQGGGASKGAPNARGGVSTRLPGE